MGKISFVPVGGLANRFRAMASALALAEMTDSDLDFYWFQDWALNAPFTSIFEPINLKRVALHTSSLKNNAVFERPRRKNLWIPRLFQKCLFRHQLYEQDNYNMRFHDDFYTQCVNDGDVYISSCYAIMKYEKRHLQALFRPVPEVRTKLDERLQAMSKKFIGVHIRRTDNVESVNNSPTELFYEKLDAELGKNPQTSIYLATDSEEVKNDFRKRYGANVTFSQKAADRDSVEGIREAFVEMLILSHAQKIYGSYGSTFSILAAEFGGTELDILKKEK